MPLLFYCPVKGQVPMFGSKDRPAEGVVAIYARTSTEKQREQDTIENQLDFARRYADLHGLRVYRVYKDEAVSGSRPMRERDEGAQLLQEAREGKFGVVLFYAIDRLARNTRDLLQTHDDLKQAGVSLRSMTEPLDTSNAVGELVMTILAAIAQLERDTIKRRTVAGRRRRARDGKWPGGYPPLGYQRDEEGYLQVNEYEATLIRRIYALYLDGFTYHDIADILQQETPRVKSRSHVRPFPRNGWWFTYISRLLQAPIYMGLTTVQGMSLKVPAIIDRETWLAAQELRRASRPRKTDHNEDHTEKFALRGLLWCGICGRIYTRRVVTRNVPRGSATIKRYLYYYHSQRLEEGYMEAYPECYHNRAMVPIDLVEGEVWERIGLFLSNPSPALEAAHARYEAALQSNQDTRALDDLNTKLGQVKRARGKILSLVAREMVSDEEAEGELSRLNQQELELKLRVERLSASSATIRARIGALRYLEESLPALRDLAQSPHAADRQEVIRTLIRRVELTHRSPDELALRIFMVME